MAMNKMGEINKARADVHKMGRVDPGPAAKKGGSEVGNERKAEVSRTQLGGSAAEAGGLRGAVGELKAQHPLKHNDHGPHHGMNHHMRHEAVGKVYK